MNPRLASAWTRFPLSLAALALAAACLSACAGPSLDAAYPVAPVTAAVLAPPAVEDKAPSFAETGLASWYGKTRKLKRTASGEMLANGDLTAAHRSLPMNTLVRVTNLANGTSILVRINDRGPFVSGRVIDVSRNAATQLGMKDAGVAPVRIEVYAADQPAKKTAKSTTIANGFAAN